MSGFRTLRQRRGAPLCIAHRGASAHAEENTLAAFKVAAELGSDAWELDVRLTADGVAVVSHDAGLQRLHGVDRDVAALSLAQLQEAAAAVPAFSAVVELAAVLGQGLYVEIKQPGAGGAVVAELRRQAFSNAVVGSFDAEEIAALRRAGCPFPLAILVRPGVDPFAAADAAGADIIHLCWENAAPDPADLVTPELLLAAAQRGLDVVLWHEERHHVIERLRRLDVLGICTNQPELLAGYEAIAAAGIKTVFHRGANHFAPENTLASARLAFDQGCAFLELDVRESADGEIVVIHDETLDRTTDGTGRVDATPFAEIAKLDAGSWFSSVYAGERIPTLREMIALCQQRGRCMYIENKSVAPQKLFALVEEMGFIEDCFFWSGNPDLQQGMRQVSRAARIKSTHKNYASPEELKTHLSPAIAEIDYSIYPQVAPLYRDLGIIPMLQYFGDDPAVFVDIAILKPEMINLNRADVLLEILRCKPQ